MAPGSLRDDVLAHCQAAQAQRSEPWAAALHALTRAVDADLASLRQIMKALTTSPDLIAGLALRVGERVGRVKPNGRLLSRSPLSNLIEIEGLLDAVRAKAAGWDALEAGGILPDALRPVLGELIRRAADQSERLEHLHRQAATTVLSPSPRP